MEPHREEQKPKEPRREEKPKRFRLIKLEERIAPASAKNSWGHKLCGHAPENNPLSIE